MGMTQLVIVRGDPVFGLAPWLLEKRPDKRLLSYPKQTSDSVTQVARAMDLSILGVPMTSMACKSQAG